MILLRISSSLNSLLNLSNFGRNLMKCHKSKELQKLKEYYHAQYVETWWIGIFEFGIMVLILQIFMILFIQKDTIENSAIIFPLAIIIVGVVVNQILSKNKNLIEYAFFFQKLIWGIVATYEGLQYKEYRFHETWLVFYSMFLIISIATCFKWKRMVILFYSIQAYQIIALHVKYSNISIYLYVSFLFATVLIPLVWMALNWTNFYNRANFFKLNLLLKIRITI